MVPRHQDVKPGAGGAPIVFAEYSEGGISIRTDRNGVDYYTGVFKYKRGGKWSQRRVVLTDEHGERILAGAKSRRQNLTAAKRALERARAKLGGVAPDRRATVADYVIGDIEGRRGTVEDSTVRGYLDYAPLFHGALDGVPMDHMTPREVRAWVRGMSEEGKAPRTIRKAFNLLSNVCERAVENGDLGANPCTVKIRREDLPKVGSPVPNALTEDGIARVNGILDGAKNPRLRVGARLALHCGLRASEACGIRWGDVDFENGVLHVRNVIGNRGAKLDGSAQYVKGTKSAAGSRDVPMTGTVARELREWMETQRAEWAKVQDGSGAIPPFGECYVLGYADGGFYAPHSLERLWGRTAHGTRPVDPSDRRRRLPEGWEPGREPITGITGDVVTFHGLRHSYATQLIKAGTDVKTASALMGHADAAMTLRIYAAADPGAMRNAAKKAAPLLECGTEGRRLRAV